MTTLATLEEVGERGHGMGAGDEHHDTGTRGIAATLTHIIRAEFAPVRPVTADHRCGLPGCAWHDRQHRQAEHREVEWDWTEVRVADDTRRGVRVTELMRPGIGRRGGRLGH